MSGPGEGKIKLGKADVYLHVKGKSNARITHIDVELAELNKIIKDKEATFCAGKPGGVFFGLKKEMIQRIENSQSLKLPKKETKFKIKRAEKIAEKEID